MTAHCDDTNHGPAFNNGSLEFGTGHHDSVGIELSEAEDALHILLIK